MRIHPTAIIHPDTRIGPDVEIGPYTVIDEGVKIGRGTKIGPYVHIEGETEIGENCQIYTGVILGTAPQDWKYRNEKTRLTIGDGTLIREYVTINRGTAMKGETKIGKRCFLMAYAHIAHDCTIGDEVIMANNATIGGHVEIGDYAVLGGLVAVHQFVRIGKLAMLGGGAMASLDVPPFTQACGDRAKLYGLNIIGLRRHGYSRETITALKKAYRILFRSKLMLRKAIEKIEERLNNQEVKYLVDFLKTSNRGFCR